MIPQSLCPAERRRTIPDFPGDLVRFSTSHHWLRLFAWPVLLMFSLFAAQAARASESSPLSSLKAIELSPEVKAGNSLPVEFPATVTYYRGWERTLFVQDQGVGIYVGAAPDLGLIPGDRVLISGMTEGSYLPIVVASHVKLLQHGKLPAAVAATFEQLISGSLDSRWVTVRGVVRAADFNYSSNRRTVQLRLAIAGGDVDAFIDTEDLPRFKKLLDAELEVTGVAGGRFDGKMNPIGIILHVPSASLISVVHPAAHDSWSLPITPTDRILGSYHQIDESKRVHVQGTLTYQQVGSAIVIQNKDHSLWINTTENNVLRPGDLVDVTGFPDVQNGFLVLDHGNVLDRNFPAPIHPVAVTWKDLAGSHHAFDLVSMEATVVSAFREPTQDNFVLLSDGHTISAIVRHRGFDVPSLAKFKAVAPGSRVRVTGVCVPGDSNPYDPDVPFNILMNSPADLVVISPPSWVNQQNLIRLVGALLILVLAVSTWGWTLRRRVRRQTAALAVRIEAEAELQRRIAYLEQRRRRIIEEINGDVPLGEILEQIAETTSYHLNHAPCWFEAASGKRYGQVPAETDKLRLLQEEISGPGGESLGRVCAALPSGTELPADADEALNEGARVAALAIETRRLYADLRHRSDFDQLTDLHNRSFLERQMSMLIADSQHTGSVFSVIYIDLDRFKEVNDQYGHHIGDLYLQEVARRMKKQLRGADLLARLGGDEFIALIPGIADRGEVEEIRQRLERCFAETFLLETCAIHGAASFGIALFPQDAVTRDALLRCADSVMYHAKRTKSPAEASRPGRS